MAAVNKRRSITSADIARAAGVSRATVSVVLTGTQSNIRVSEDTRQRVLSAAADLHYSPHPAAQALRRQRTSEIAFVPRTMHKTEFGDLIAYQLHLYASRAAARRGYRVVEVTSEISASDDGDELFAFLLSRHPDGVIFDAPATDNDVRRIMESGIPVVQLMRPHSTVATPRITVDASEGIRDAIDHLVGLGHRRIAFLGSDDATVVARFRQDYFVAALARHGITVPAEYIALGPDYTLEQRTALARRVLECPSLPTALFASGDIFAIGALHALHAARIRVPDAMSVVSYDDVYAAMLYPPITSVHQPLREIAECAIELLTQQIDQPADAVAEPAHVVFPTHLNVRESTQPPHGGD
jgi:LacI family transcriptional regulator